MNDKGLVLDGQRGVESYERGEKVGLKTNLETRNDNNLAKLNDAKSIISARFFLHQALTNEENAGILAKHCFVN